MLCQLRTSLAALSIVAAAASTSRAQAVTSRDSALVDRILLAEDRRDSANTVFAAAAGYPDERIRLLGRRGLARIRDPKFAARDSFPAPAAPPAYPDPAWRLRFRALAIKPLDCGRLAAALSDSAWAVRLRAADLATADCSGDTSLVRTLKQWADAAPGSAARRAGEPSWHPAAHAIVALAKVTPADGRARLASIAASRIPWLRIYAARAAAVLGDSAALRRLARDIDDNVREAAIDGLSKVSGHAADDVYIAALSSRGYQVVRAAANALKGSPKNAAVFTAAYAAAQRLRADRSETSRDARRAVLDRLAEVPSEYQSADIRGLAADFDCDLAAVGAKAANVKPRCTPLPVAIPPEAVALALGEDVRLRVTLADSSGGGSFVVRLRGDVAPIMAARVLALVKSGWYDGRTWYRVEPDFVIQGGGPGANEYVGHPRFMRDELSALPQLRGTVGMSTRGHDTGDAQWFVNLRDNQRLTRDYTAFGEIVEGIGVVDGILEGDVIKRIEVVSAAPRR